MVHTNGGERITRLREARGIRSKEALARLAGVSVKSVSRLEAGESLRADTLAKVARALECDVWDLIGIAPPDLGGRQMDRLERKLDCLLRAIGVDPDTLADHDDDAWLKDMPERVLAAASETTRLLSSARQPPPASSEAPANDVPAARPARAPAAGKSGARARRRRQA